VGAVLLGKTTTPGFGWKAIGDSASPTSWRSMNTRKSKVAPSPPAAHEVCRESIGPASRVRDLRAGWYRQSAGPRARLLRRPIVIRNAPHYNPYSLRPIGDVIKVLYHGIVAPDRGLEALHSQRHTAAQRVLPHDPRARAAG
jgi:hypothetical protein